MFAGGGHPGRRGRVTTVPDSGLTGSVDIPDPEPAEEPKDLRSRLARLRRSVGGLVKGLPRVVKLAWDAGRWPTVWLVFATIVGGLTPTATAYISKLLIDSVTNAIRVHAERLPDVVHVGPLALGTVQVIIGVAGLQLLVYVLNSMMTAASTISQQLLTDRVSQTIRLRVMAHASRLDLAFFEGSSSYDLLRQAQDEAPSRPVSMLTSVFSLIRTGITFASMIALLLSISPLLALVAVLSPIPAFIADSRYGARSYVFAVWTSPIHRRCANIVA